MGRLHITFLRCKETDMIAYRAYGIIIIYCNVFHENFKIVGKYGIILSLIICALNRLNQET